MKKNYQSPEINILQLQTATSLLTNSVTSVDSDTGIEYGGGSSEPARVHDRGNWGDIWD